MLNYKLQLHNYFLAKFTGASFNPYLPILDKNHLVLFDNFVVFGT